MSCYKPLIRVEDTFKWETAVDGHRYHPARVISDDMLERYDKKYQGGAFRYKVMPIACGNCIGCNLDYSRDWANRGYIESTLWKQNYFVTLTYDDEHLPMREEITTSDGITYTEIPQNEWKGCLEPKDFTQFMKNFRQIEKRDYNHENIRFIGCGEYGTKNKRPHYHLILFNCQLPIESFYNPKVNWEKNVYWQNNIIERAWNKGISNICEATWENIAYTARYITKKINGTESEDIYACQGQLKEFFRTSRNPGIGRDYYEAHKNQIYKNDQITIRTKKGLRTIKPPAYFDRLYEQENPKHMQEIKEERRRKQIQALKIKAQYTSLTRWEQLQVEADYKEDKTLALKREL